MNNQILSEEQQEIVDYWLTKQGPLIVEAAAGSGKTRVLTECVRILLAKPKEKFKVLCITFTNKASEEMKDRLSNVKEIRDRAFIGTVHGFALEVLKSFKHEVGYSEMPHIIERDSDRKNLIREVILQNPTLADEYNDVPFNEAEDKFKANYLNDCSEFISQQKRQLITVSEEDFEYPDWTSTQLVLFKGFNQLLRNQNLIDYDDILVLAWKILSERDTAASVYQRIYKYIVVDEAQDLNYAQYHLLKALCGSRIKNVLMVGDGNQSIHGYAGASKKFMLEDFVADFQVESNSRKRINYNYRSAEAVINIANAIKPGSTSHVNSFFRGKAEILSLKNENAESIWIINKIKELLQSGVNPEFDGTLSLDKIAVLGRNRFVFNVLKKNLDEDLFFKDKYYLKKGTDSIIPESSFMKVFELGTRILTNKSGLIYLNQLKGILGINQTEIKVSNDGIELLKGLSDLISAESIIRHQDYQQLVGAWEAIDKKVNNLSNVLADFHSIVAELLDESERLLATYDIQYWEEAWSKYIRSVPANSISLSDYRRFIALGVTTGSHESDLTLATVHMVKGLEFHVVFLMGMGEGTFPDYRSSVGRSLEEERNNAYVAVTRAKRILYITYPRTKTLPWGAEKYQAPSQFISSLPIVSI